MIIRIFPHSKDEFETEDALTEWLSDVLPEERNGRYRLRSTNGVGQIPPGSVILFRFRNHIVGHAAVAQGVTALNEIIDGIRYEAMIRFEPTSIRVYADPLPIELLQQITGRSLAFARAYYKFKDADDIFREVLLAVGDGNAADRT